MKYIFIVNCRKDKAAIRQEVESQLAELQGELESRGDVASVYLTTGEGDATREVRLYSDLHPTEKVCFVACGGDGTVNEVASGIVGFENKSLAVLDLHSNNDFVKYYPGRNFKSIRAILNGDDTKIDIIRINDSYSINVCDIGFDAVVASRANELTMKGRKNVFRLGVLRAMFFGRFNHARIVADGERIGRRRLLLCTLANGKYVGGEFLTAPRACNNDGLIELCHIRPILLITFLLMLKTYVRGKHLEHKFFSRFVTYRQVKHVEVTSRQMIELCLDGELLPGTKFMIDIMPNEICLRLPQFYN